MRIRRLTLRRLLSAPCYFSVLSALAWAIALPGNAQKHIVLQGRIEEVAGEAQPKLPELKSMTPKLDTRDQSVTKTAATGTAHSTAANHANPRSLNRLTAGFPVTWRGSWSGQISILSSKFFPASSPMLERDLDMEKKLIVPGLKGTVTITFKQDAPQMSTLVPMSIAFPYPASAPSASKITLTGRSAAAYSNSTDSDQLISMEPERKFTIEMNSFSSGISAGGNVVSNRILKNEIRQLAANVLEQDLVNFSTETEREARTTLGTYSEDVLRFTQVNERTMLVQAVSLSYDDRGRCDSTIFMSGYVYKNVQQ